MTILTIIQIGTAVLLIASILLQQTGAGLSETFGGSGGDTSFTTRRGFEKVLFQGTIVLGVVFAVSSLAAIFVA